VSDLSDREREILNCIVQGWNGDLVGHVSYQEAFELLDRLGLQRPARVVAELERLEAKSREYQAARRPTP
jgi:hypothetical protein